MQHHPPSYRSFMIGHFIDHNKYVFATLAGIIVFFIAKIDYLNLPFYWDEAWVYGPAVRQMAMTKISFLPDALPVDLYRGHPLLFYVLNASWIKLFGNTLFSVHLFNLLIACILIFVVYLFCKKHYTEPIGVAAALITCLQPVMLAQSTLVLPEVMLGLFCLLALYFFLQNKYWGYLLFAVAASLTKETGIAVIITCCFLFLINGNKGTSSRWRYFQDLIKTVLPIIPLFVFILIQKKMHGWYFFPEHVGFISFDLSDFGTKFITRYLTFTFLLQGRNLLCFAMIISIGWLIYKKQLPEHIKVSMALLLFILVYSFIGSLNFFSKRYILCQIPVFIILALGVTFTTFKNKLLLAVFLIVISLAQIKYIRFENNSDHNPGFVNAVKANQAMINYCLDQEMNDKNISVFFILRRIMSDPLAGYVKTNEVFTNLDDKPLETDYFIVSNYDTDNFFIECRNRSEMNLIKRYEFKTAWIELYRNNRISITPD